jgi:hypothetical protein
MALYIGSKTPRVFASKKADPVVQHNPLILLRPPAPEKYWMSEESVPRQSQRCAAGEPRASAVRIEQGLGYRTHFMQLGPIIA